MNKLNTPIVVVAYNRPRSLTRLLNSLKKSSFPNKNIDLIISIDKGSNNEAVLDVANNFIWDFGDKKVVYQEENLGLRAHILKCGSLSDVYGSVIVLEDDLYVSSNFYNYAIEALKFSKDKPYIGGVSLYNHQLNVHTRDNFLAIDDGYDNWYFQFASSWGQAWSKDQWSGFMEWYNKTPEINKNTKIPAYVRSWSEKSWLKYNISYLIEKEMYFFYPRISLSTNFSDAGTHVGQDSTIYQVPMDYSIQKKYIFSEIDQSKAVYDAFYENSTLANSLDLNLSDICIDLYGYKQRLGQKYLLSSKILSYKIVRSYGKSLKPLDTNILENIEGDELFLYDTDLREENKNKPNFKRRLTYNVKQLNFNDALKFVKSELARKIQNGIRKLIGK